MSELGVAVVQPARRGIQARAWAVSRGRSSGCPPNSCSDFVQAVEKARAGMTAPVPDLDSVIAEWAEALS